MTIVEIDGITIITPSEGMYLTNGTTYSSRVYLGANDSAANWSEVDSIPTEDEDATEADYLAALAELGVRA